MDQAQIQLIRDNWASIRPLAAIAVHRFYGYLLVQDAGARILVPEDFSLQGWKLINFIDNLILCLDMPSAWVSLAREFARCDAAQALIHRHSAAVGQALLKALADVLMERFTDDAREAWAQAYELIANAIYAASVEDDRAAA